MISGMMLRIFFMGFCLSFATSVICLYLFVFIFVFIFATSVICLYLFVFMFVFIFVLQCWYRQIRNVLHSLQHVSNFKKSRQEISSIAVNKRSKNCTGTKRSKTWNGSNKGKSCCSCDFVIL